MATFSTNPHPSNDSISGRVCSLVLSEGVDEIKLKNLNKMIEVILSVCSQMVKAMIVREHIHSAVFPADLPASCKCLSHQI